MFPTVTRTLASLSRPPAVRFHEEFLENSGGLTGVYRKLVAFFWSDSGLSVISLLYSVGALFAITAPAWMLLCSSRRKKRSSVATAEINGESPEGLIDGIIGEVAIIAGDATCGDDTNYSEGSSFCQICLENIDNWQMFTNDECSHSFCYDCTSSHIVSKIQDKVKQIPCPALCCKAFLNTNVCRLMIPDDALVQLDELLCMSLIPESQKLYCPFRDCSTLLVNDSGELTRQITCPICKRQFCTKCRAPSHPEFTCKEFQKLHVKKDGKSSKMVKSLAKKKHWRRCPNCKMYVEKAEGCIHITCRCEYQFCYSCGSKWENHVICWRNYWRRKRLIL